MMYYYLAHVAPDNKQVYFVGQVPSNEDADADYRYVDRKLLENMYPSTLNDKVDMIMLNLGKQIKRLGDTFTVKLSGTKDEIAKKSFYGPIFVCDTILPQPFLNVGTHSEQLYSFNREISATFNVLKEYGYVKYDGVITPALCFTFTVDGWRHLGNLQSKNEAHAQAFIAMWFNPEMNEARDVIKKAIVDCGYIPVIIDEKDHNNQIAPEILFEIKRSKFMVADLTKHRNGVYYEAGYAQALNKEVILTCKKSHFRRRHFDVAQKSTIVWTDEEDLYKRLIKRIEATVGKRINVTLT